MYQHIRSNPMYKGFIDMVPGVDPKMDLHLFTRAALMYCKFQTPILPINGVWTHVEVPC